MNLKTNGILKKLFWLIIIIVIVAFVIIFSKQNSGVSNSTIKVGAVIPLSGTSSYIGEEMKKGMEMCNPGNLKFFFEDSFGTAQQGISAFNKLTQIDKVDATVVAMSTVVPAILPIAKERKDFVITAVVTAADVAKNGGGSVFRYYSNGYNAAKVIADSMVKKNTKKIGILYVQNEFGETYKRGMEDFLKDKDVSVYPESFLATETDFSTALLKLKQSNVDSIIVIAYDKQTIQAITKIKDQKIDVDIYTAWMWNNSDFSKNSSVFEGVYVPRSFYLFGSNEKVVKFNNDFKTKYGAEASQFSAVGCDLAILVGENNINTSEKMTKLNKFSGINGEITQDEYGEFDFPIKMIQYTNGSVKELN